MENISQQNKEEIIKLHGKIDLINQDLKTVKENHLAHLDEKINDIRKILWFVCAIVLSNIAVAIRQLIIG
jgi:pyruvate-formate lyase-activating enzyme|tara:strand:- start:44 stop:253 length:210 start_codon:yes stop_codon:yes gene_type:complete